MQGFHLPPAWANHNCLTEYIEQPYHLITDKAHVEARAYFGKYQILGFHTNSVVQHTNYDQIAQSFNACLIRFPVSDLLPNHPPASYRKSNTGFVLLSCILNAHPN